MRIHTIVRATIFWMVAFSISTSMANPPAAQSNPLYTQLAILNIQLRGESGQRRAEIITEKYRMLAAGFSPCLRPTGDAAISEELFRATAFAEFYSLADADVDTLGCLYGELSADGRSTDWHTLTYAGALVTVARFATANQYLAQVEGGRTPMLPQITSAPDLPAGAQWRYLSLESDSSAITNAWTPVTGQLQIVAVVHPACAFSARALSDIASQNDLRWLRERLLLLVPPDPSLPAEGILHWNSAHPNLPMQRMYTRSDWQPLSNLDTPTFYLMRGAEVVQVFEGWPNAEGLAKMQAALSR